MRRFLVQISRGAAVHLVRESGVTACGRTFHSGGFPLVDYKITCKRCVKVDESQRRHYHSGPCHETCEVHAPTASFKARVQALIEAKATVDQCGACGMEIYAYPIDDGLDYGPWQTGDGVKCLRTVSGRHDPDAQPEMPAPEVVRLRTPSSLEAEAQEHGAMERWTGRMLPLLSGGQTQNLALVQALVHGWHTGHESCDCKISDGKGNTFDLATHTMIPASTRPVSKIKKCKIGRKRHAFSGRK